MLMVIGRLDDRTGQTRRTLAARHPDKPWFWRDDWEKGYVRPEATSQAATWMTVGALLLLLSAPLALRLRDELTRRGNYAALVGLVFPIVGLLMVSKSAVSWLRHRKFANLLHGHAIPPGTDFGWRVETYSIPVSLPTTSATC